MTQSLTSLALAFSMATPAALVAAGPASATPPADHSVTASAYGGLNPTVESGDTVQVVKNAQVSSLGAKSQTIQACFNAGNASLNTDSIKAPSGYVVQYSTNNGSTWSTKKPRNPDLINCVRAVGRITSGGVMNGSQAFTATGSLTPPSTPGRITLSGGGDGFNTFFDPAYTKVFNIYHHDSPRTVDCHLLADGSPCSGFPITLTQPTNHKPYGVFTDATHMWIPSGNGNSYGFGFDCVNAVAGTKCSDVGGGSGWIKLANGSGGSWSYNNFINGAVAGGKVFAYDRIARKLLCLDPSTKAACAGMPSGGWATGLSSGAYSDTNMQDMLAIDSQVYMTDGATEGARSYEGGKVYCFDASTMATCASSSGSWPKNAAGPRLAKTVSAMGFSEAGVCTLGVSSQCYGQSAGANLGTLTGLNGEFSATMSAAPSNGDPYNQGSPAGIMSTVDVQGSRYYWSRGNWYDVNSAAPIVACFDFATNARCAKFPLTAQAFYDVDVSTHGSTYAVNADPVTPNCVWTNDNFANILSWNTLTGAPGCQKTSSGGGSSSEPSEFQNPVSKAIGKMSCDGRADNASWISASIKSPLQNGKVGKLYVDDTWGNPVAGWQGSSATVVDGAATYDLTSLDPDVTGPDPKFRFESADLGPNAKVRLTLTAVGSTPQLCFSVDAKVSCPSLKALDSGALPSGADVAFVTSDELDGSTVASSSSSGFSVIGANIWDCATYPAAPRIQKVTGGTDPGSVTLNFSDGPHFGGMPDSVGYYWIMDGGWASGYFSSTAKSQTLTNLPSGYHCFNVQTYTDYGWSSYSNQRCVNVPGNPGKPYFTWVTRSNSRLTFYWDPPSDFGGASRLQYLLKVRDASNNVVKTCLTRAWSCEVTGLTNQSQYSATVEAISVYGRSDTDWTSDTPAGPIGQPTNVTWSATGDRTQLNLAWTAPRYDSNDALSYYQVCAYDGGNLYDCWTTNTESVTVTGLTPKVRYNFIVFANSLGGNVKGSPIFRHRGQ